MQSQTMCHGHTQTGKMAWAGSHNSRYPGRCYQPTCTMKPPCKSSVTPLKRHMVLVSIWCQSKVTLSFQPSFPPNARWRRSNHQLSLVSSSCKTCNSGQGGTIKIETRTEHLSVVLRLHNRTLVDQGGPLSMAHICLQPCVSNSVNAANN